MARLLCDGVEVAPLVVAADRRARARGLLGLDGLEGALLLPGVRAVHTLGMRFPIDVAFVDASDRVLTTLAMVPWRIGRSRWRARAVVEASSGSFERWGLRPGTSLAFEAAA